VVEKNYVVYFKANGHQFCSAAGRIYHEKAIMYDAVRRAARAGDPLRRPVRLFPRH
jgi:hypothetical protein